MGRKLMRRAEAAVYSGIPPRTLYALVRSGALSAYRWGREWRFDQQDLDRWLEAHKTVVRQRGVPAHGGGRA